VNEVAEKLRHNAKNAFILGNEGLGGLLLDGALEIDRLAAEVERLDRLAYLRIPIPRFLRRKKG